MCPHLHGIYVYSVWIYVNMDVSLIDSDIRKITRNANVLLNACKDINLAVNIEKPNYMEVGCHWDIMANELIAIDGNSYDKMKTFKCLGSLLTNQNFIRKEIKYRFKEGNLCYYLIQTVLSSQIFS